MANNSIGPDTYAAVVQSAIDAIVQQNTASGIINFALNVFPSAENCTEEYRLAHDGLDENGDILNPNTEPAMDFDIACEAASRYYWSTAPLGTAPGPSDYSVPVVPFVDDVTMDTYTAIHDALNDVGQCGGTPICQSLWWAYDYLQQVDSPNRTYVILATDGAPSCSHTLSPATCETSIASGQEASYPEQCLDDKCSVNAALYLAAKRYRTFVVGVGEEAATFGKVLDAIAYFGGGNGTGCTITGENPYGICEPPAGQDTWFFPAANASTLSAALEDITNSTLTCEFEVPWGEVPDVDPNNPEMPVAKSCDMVKAKAVVDGLVADTDVDTEEDPNLIIYDAGCNEVANYGWRWADEALRGASWNEVKEETNTDNCRTIKLCPRACEKLQVHNGEREWQSVAASFGCAPVVAIE